MEVGLSLGTNLGNRLGNLALARKKTAEIRKVEIAAWSPVYETEPVDVPEEFRNKRFLNAVLIIRCGLAPTELSIRLRCIEAEMGRSENNVRNAPRPIDIDIIYADQLRISSKELTVPHPRWAERRFVAQPLADVRPDLMLPASTLTVRQVLLSLPQSPKVVLFTEEW